MSEIRISKINTIVLIFIACILFINYFFSNDLLALFATGMAMVYLMTCDRKILIPSMVFLSLFSYLYRYNGFELYVFVCLIYIIRIMFRSKRNLVNGTIGMLFYILVHMLSTSIFNISFADFLPFIVIWCLYYSVISFDRMQKKLVIRYFVGAHLLASIMGVFKSNCRLGEILSTDYLSISSWQDTLRYSGLSYDANFYTILALIAFFLVIFVMKDELKMISWLALSGSILVFGALTYSKSFYFCAVVLIMYAIFSTDRSIRKKVIKVVPLIVLICIVAGNQILSILGNFVGRLDDTSNIYVLTTGRIELWYEYVQYIFADFYSVIFGNGIISNGLKAAHNTYLEILYKFGFLGSFVDIGYFWICKRRFYYNIKMNKSCVVMIILFLILLFNLSAYTFYGLWLSIFVLWVSGVDDKEMAQID